LRKQLNNIRRYLQANNHKANRLTRSQPTWNFEKINQRSKGTYGERRYLQKTNKNIK